MTVACSALLQASGPTPAALVVMRHGKREDTINSTWQAKARFPWDTPLCAMEAEIGEASEKLLAAGRSFDVVYSSPFLRCLQTAERTMQHLGCNDVPVLVHRGLSEVHGPGLLFKCRYPTAAQRARLWLWHSAYGRISRAARERFSRKARLVPASRWPTLPESDPKAAARFKQVIAEIAAKHPGQRVLVVSHGMSVLAAYEALGLSGRLVQVMFAGFVACRARGQHHQQLEQKQQEGQQQQQQQQQQQEKVEVEVEGQALDDLQPQKDEEHARGQPQQQESKRAHKHNPVVLPTPIPGAGAGGAWSELELDPELPFWNLDVEFKSSFE
ncbi:hypothetical protein CHLRE_10g440250v5 [Chlamydomonas reinhardtii]|uniref:Phosphoglycerate mutase-like protein n=1 Tax=Chlamydomonas reinhardtii TaxID=3055 RepID=A0A2K3DAG1_CHLRE|nr:uncharacterized protein CHLRE_10g440250v5 [Chlamydomonas reinhardtii]PNW77520.1 hypothetical protein CHLRE_10g440250v5 [Chlamydomonas reinhardtii]